MTDDQKGEQAPTEDQLGTQCTIQPPNNTTDDQKPIADNLSLLGVDDEDYEGGGGLFDMPGGGGDW